ncbi:type I 3-dehydroquinate dehydratase [Brachybacterium alimentarium]|uniref:3-dehydroquinate dehydratase n=1 Tax=Brachybacterium alimentarium TaxID=47845 RepID=A0A2A3YL33_9MICO|nr:type I 3-dehydroquinate dehydratase [Brachybacterium alimentarium]PCC36141.1 type I 3-dehydroquinate dehydratase [Brachybacterium alimentarium]PCC40472.1 type I 3-dehydroquinate dehydratase [Brachybacterium alimentarium]RCS76971.1 type I 3-dehydroquinate dehydratase [Brachybacterium alimentarium]RCS78788.1 type I 3-dehydroquinate dehydratase [Brachybacterium alimentarium]RCS84190.1 type I 3-dehydroquinate dehydratase [Brachybacterium alimentarium]
MTESIPITATVRGIELGRARPEIIVPLVGDDHDAVMEQAAAAVATPARIIEWRIDLFRPDLDDAEDHRDVVLATLPRLRAALGPDRALLATVRTSAEGGGRQIRDIDLAVLLEALMGERRAGTQSQVDMIDVETSRAPAIVSRVVSTAHRNGVVVVGSYHDFEGTPEEEELCELLRSQRRLGADVPKIAVTPQTPRDVLTLMSASLTVASEGAGPHIAISMGPLGVASRVAAETFGSAATFATAGPRSAPGQLEADDVARMLELLRP